MDQFVSAWRSATTAELAWVDGAGEPAALTVVPLLEGGAVPCAALTYDHAGLLPALTGARTMAFALTDSRSVRGPAGVAAVGRASIAQAVDGAPPDLLEQELRRFPPARALADSPLLRRENWWYLPRIVVRLDRVDRTHELTVRRDPAGDALLVRAEPDGGLRLDVVGGDWSDDPVELRAGEELRGDGSPALAHGHDHTPDRERWETWQVRGVLHGDVLRVAGRVGRPGLTPGAPGLRERWRRVRALERGCRRGIATAERARP